MVRCLLVLYLTTGVYGLLTPSPRRITPNRCTRRSVVSCRGPIRHVRMMAWGAPVSKQDESKQQLLEVIKPLDRGLSASDDDVARVETLTQELEKLNPNPESLASPLINGRWELLYTTSASILGKRKPRRLRPKGPIYQDIDAVGLRAKNSQYIKPLPFVRIYNAVRAALSPTSPSAVDVQFIQFRVGPFRIKAPESAKGSLDTTYLDEGLRVSRGDKGNLFILSKVEDQKPDFS